MGSADDEINRILDKSLALAREELYEENEALLRDALARFPDDPDLLLSLGTTLDEPEEMKELIRRAIALDPNDPGKLFRAAQAMYHLADLATAGDYARRALEAEPPDVIVADLVHLVGKLAIEVGHDRDAEEALSYAFEEEPESNGHGLDLAEFYADRGRLAEALEVITTALRHRPDDEALQELRENVVARLG